MCPKLLKWQRLLALGNYIAYCGDGLFLFDGVFVGLTRAKDMRNTMLFSALVGFFGLFWISE